MVAGIAREFGIQPQQKVHAAERFGSLQISKRPEAWQIKVVLDDECAKLRVNLLPEGLKARHFRDGRGVQPRRRLPAIPGIRDTLCQVVWIKTISGLKFHRSGFSNRTSSQ